jgi:hypothetical protein
MTVYLSACFSLTFRIRAIGYDKFLLASSCLFVRPSFCLLHGTERLLQDGFRALWDLY